MARDAGGGGGAPSGPASGSLGGTYPGPTVLAIDETGGQKLAIGAVGASEMLQRSGTDLVGVKGVVSLSVPALSNEMAFFSGTSGQLIVGGSGFTRDPGGPRLKANITDASTIQGITYRDNAASATSRFAFKVGNDLVQITNTVANGVVEIVPNTSTAGSGGAQVGAHYEDDLIQWSTAAAVRMQIDDAGQVGIPTPVSEALLALTSTTKAFGLPAMTEAQRDAIAPTAGFEAFNTDTGVPSFADGADWFDVPKATPALFTRFGFTVPNTDQSTVMTHQVGSIFTQILAAAAINNTPTTGTHVDPNRNGMAIEITTFTAAGTLRLTGSQFNPATGVITGGFTEDIAVTATGWIRSANLWDAAASVVISTTDALDVVIDTYNFSPIEISQGFTIDEIEAFYDTTAANNSVRLFLRKMEFPGGPVTLVDETIASLTSGTQAHLIRIALATAVPVGTSLLIQMDIRRAADVRVRMAGAYDNT